MFERLVVCVERIAAAYEKHVYALQTHVALQIELAGKTSTPPASVPRPRLEDPMADERIQVILDQLTRCSADAERGLMFSVLDELKVKYGKNTSTEKLFSMIQDALATRAGVVSATKPEETEKPTFIDKGRVKSKVFNTVATPDKPPTKGQVIKVFTDLVNTKENGEEIGRNILAEFKAGCITDLAEENYAESISKVMEVLNAAK